MKKMKNTLKVKMNEEMRKIEIYEEKDEEDKNSYWCSL